MRFPAFDTLEFVDELEKSGIPEKQARAISVAVRKVHDSSDVATKGDISELRHEISDLRKDMDAKFAGMDAEFAGVDAKLASMEERFNAKIDKLGLQIVNKLGGLIVAGVVVIAAAPVLFKYLHVG